MNCRMFVAENLQKKAVSLCQDLRPRVISQIISDQMISFLLHPELVFFGFFRFSRKAWFVCWNWGSTSTNNGLRVWGPRTWKMQNCMWIRIGMSTTFQPTSNKISRFSQLTMALGSVVPLPWWWFQQGGSPPVELQNVSESAVHSNNSFRSFGPGQPRATYFYTHLGLQGPQDVNDSRIFTRSTFVYFEGKASGSPSHDSLDSWNLRSLLQCCERWQQPALQPFAWIRSSRKCIGNGQKLSEVSRPPGPPIRGPLDAGVAVVAKQIDTVLAYNGSVHLPKSMLKTQETKKPDWYDAFLQWWHARFLQLQCALWPHPSCTFACPGILE